MKNHFPALNGRLLVWVPTNAGPLTLTVAECLSFWSTRPAVELLSVKRIVYVPAFRLVTLFPLKLRVSLPAAFTVPISVPRNGSASEPARSVELTVVWLLEESPLLLASGGGAPNTVEFVWKVWMTPGNA